MACMASLNRDRIDISCLLEIDLLLQVILMIISILDFILNTITLAYAERDHECEYEHDVGTLATGGVLFRCIYNDIT